MHCYSGHDAEISNSSSLSFSMLDVSNQRKRRRRLTTLVETEPVRVAVGGNGIESGSVDDGDGSSDQRHSRIVITRRIRTMKSVLSKTERRTTMAMTMAMKPSNRRWTLWTFLMATASTAVFVLLGSMFVFDATDAFQTTRQLQTRPTLSSPSSLSMSLATPPIPGKSELESMKVTELKQLIKDSGLNERGLLSKLKKKGDLVEFLAERGTSPSPSTRPPRVVIENPKASTPMTPVTVTYQTKTNRQPPPPPPRKKVPLTMPKKSPPITTTTKPSPSKLSPRDEMYERLNEQYPPLRYLKTGNSTVWGENDVRQKHHPMLRAGNLIADDDDDTDDDDNDNEINGTEKAGQSRKRGFKPALSGDMDLIFIGTASCTPSITRGVSCTALRLHSLPSSSSVSNKKQQQQQHQIKNFKVSKSSGNNPESQRFDVSSSSQSNLGTWLFDCGESTQLQIQKTSSVKPGKITKIFLTHAHGDHSFGLPGLLCIMGQDTAGGNESGERGPNGENIRKTKDSRPVIDIYGPEGLRMWLRTAIRYSVSRIVPRYRVHELKDVTMAPEWGYSPKWEKYFFNKKAYFDQRNGNHNNNNNNGEYYWGAANDQRVQSLKDPRRRNRQPTDWMSLCEQGVPRIEPSELYGEVDGGRDIHPIFDHPLSSDGAPVWEVENEGDGGVKVYAGPMSHGIPCVGYVIQEADRPGRLRDELVKPICQRNIPALKEAGFRHPMKALAVIKDLPEGGSFTFPDGTVVTQEEAVEPTRPGRKVVICGDTNSARGLEKLAENADVLVHEATNTFIPHLDHRDSSPRTVTQEAIFHGHSTPLMAGDFAKRTKAKRLILNHFSARYMADQSLESMSIMTRIEDQAIKASGLDKTAVAAAWDFMIFPIPKPYDKKKSSDNDESEEKNS